MEKEIWDYIKWLIMAVVGFLGVTFTIKSFKKDSHKDIYKKLDELERMKADKSDLERISQQNMDQIDRHNSDNKESFNMLMSYIQAQFKYMDDKISIILTNSKRK